MVIKDPVDGEGDSLTVQDNCDPLNLRDGEFGIRFLNATPWNIDAIDFDRFKHFRDDGTVAPITQRLLGLETGKVSCHRPYDLRYVNRFGDLVLYEHYSISALLPFQSGPIRGRFNKFDFTSRFYVYKIMVNPYLEVHNGIGFILEDTSATDLGIRFVNQMPSEVSDLAVHFPDTTITLPMLSPWQETDYFILPRMYPHGRVQYVIGTDTVDSYGDDHVGESLIYSGRFRLNIDSLHYRFFKEEGVLAEEVN